MDLLMPGAGLSVLCCPEELARALTRLRMSLKVLKVLLRDSSDGFCEKSKQHPITEVKSL